MKASKAISAINQSGILLTFPLNNRKDIPSLWSSFFPKSKMVWEWDSSGDNRVADLWHLREELSRSKKVVYAKWFQGRATFFSRTIYKALLAETFRLKENFLPLSEESHLLMEIMQMNSPLSTKTLKKRSELLGRDLETIYQKALKELWNRFLIVGFGEIDDGAFPSLAIGSTELIFEDLWHEAETLSPTSVQKSLSLLQGNVFHQYYQRTLRKLLRAA
jgi:hypothetical protein